MVDVLNPEHTGSKTLNTTLEANEVTAVETQTDAPESNHHFSAAAETQPREQNTDEPSPQEPEYTAQAVSTACCT